MASTDLRIVLDIEGIDRLTRYARIQWHAVDRSKVQPESALPPPPPEADVERFLIPIRKDSTIADRIVAYRAISAATIRRTQAHQRTGKEGLARFIDILTRRQRRS